MLLENLEPNITYSLLFIFRNNTSGIIYISIEYPVIIKMSNVDNIQYFVVLYNNIINKITDYLKLVGCKEINLIMEIHKIEDKKSINLV